MPDGEKRNRFLFPPWANYLLPAIGVLAIGGAVYVPVVIGLGASPRTTDVGYMPEQPVPYSHALHAGQLGIDCRYCHTTVEKAGFAAVPPTQTCMNCHAKLNTDSPLLLKVRESYVTGMPVPWVKVHNLPDYAYFNHSTHLNKGIGCVSCHGRVDRMEVVYQQEPLSMSWCLDCHRQPEKHLRPVEFVTRMDWLPGEDQLEMGRRLKAEYNIHDAQYLTSCSVCHR
jgi:menaquinone reductase, multiheme cytochrome c subunit